MALGREHRLKVSLLCRRRVTSPRCVRFSTQRLKYDWQAYSQLDLRRVFQAVNPGPGLARQPTRRLPQEALPNPSFKPSPNSKTPGPRCSVGVHFLQRGPGVLLPVPA